MPFMLFLAPNYLQALILQRSPQKNHRVIWKKLFVEGWWKEILPRQIAWRSLFFIEAISMGNWQRRDHEAEKIRGNSHGHHPQHQVSLHLPVVAYYLVIFGKFQTLKTSTTGMNVSSFCLIISVQKEWCFKVQQRQRKPAVHNIKSPSNKKL